MMAYPPQPQSQQQASAGILHVDVSRTSNSAQAIKLLEASLVGANGAAVHLNSGHLLLTPKVLSKISDMLRMQGSWLEAIYASLPQTQQAALDCGLMVREKPLERPAMPILESGYPSPVRPHSQGVSHSAGASYRPTPLPPSVSFDLAAITGLPLPSVSPAASIQAAASQTLPGVRQVVNGPSLPFGNTMELPEELLTPMMAEIERPATALPPAPSSIQESGGLSVKDVVAMIQPPQVVSRSTPQPTLQSAATQQPQVTEVPQASTPVQSVAQNLVQNLAQSGPVADAHHQSSESIQPRLQELPTLYFESTLRSGQVIRYQGNVVVLGDVHGGSEISAAGSILIWGELKGIAHAGCEGNRFAEIRALKIEAIQLRIADLIARRPDRMYYHKPQEGSSAQSGQTSFTPEVARIAGTEIQIFNDVIGK